MLNHCLEWDNFDHDRQWFNTLIPPSHESTAVIVDRISRLSGPVRLALRYTAVYIRHRDGRYVWDGGIKHWPAQLVGRSEWHAVSEYAYIVCPDAIVDVVVVWSSGAVKLDIELDKITIDQCTNSADVFFNTHRCQPSTSVSFFYIWINENTYSANFTLMILNYTQCCTSILIAAFFKVNWMKDNVLPVVVEVKDLGVMVDSHLSFDTHISKTVARAFTRANLIH